MYLINHESSLEGSKHEDIEHVIDYFSLNGNVITPYLSVPQVMGRWWWVGARWDGGVQLSKNG